MSCAVFALTDPALLAGARVGLDHVRGVHPNIEAETQRHTPRLHLHKSDVIAGHGWERKTQMLTLLAKFSEVLHIFRDSRSHPMKPCLN